MFNRLKFKAAVVEKGLRMRDVANALEISEVTLYRKMNGSSDFYRHEIQKLCQLLELKDPEEIFFTSNVT